MLQTCTRSQRWMLRGGLLGTSLLATLLLIEMGLRATGFNKPVPLCRDPHRGYGYEPHLHWLHTSEGQGHVVTNQFGFRDAEWMIDKPANTVRIAVLGDSFVEALQVEKENRFTDLVRAELSSSELFRGRQVEVMNFGISGYGTAQELQTWRHEVRQFQPDFVVLTFLTANDIRNNSFALEQDPVRPYFEEKDGDLILDESFRLNQMPFGKRAGLIAARYSRIGQVAWHAYQGSKAGKRTARSEDSRDAQLVERGLMSAGLDSAVYREPETEDWKRAWDVTLKLVAEMNREVTATGARFLVLIASNDIQVDPDHSRRAAFMQLAGVSDLFLPDHKVIQFCNRHRIPALALAPLMQRSVDATGDILHGFPNTRMGIGHWNESGHLLAAGIFCQWFLDELQPGSIESDRQPTVLTRFEKPASNVRRDVEHPASKTIPAE